MLMLFLEYFIALFYDLTNPKLEMLYERQTHQSKIMILAKFLKYVNIHKNTKIISDKSDSYS